jgi:hypothetical protein
MLMLEIAAGIVLGYMAVALLLGFLPYVLLSG